MVNNIISTFQIDNVIGTVGLVQSIITLDSNPEELFLLVQGVYRFKLDVTVTEKPLKINKIITIEDFKNLSGNLNCITTTKYYKSFNVIL